MNSNETPSGRQVTGEQGRLFSDDLPELQQNCDRILVMRQGRIADSFAPDVTEKTLYEAMLASGPTQPTPHPPAS